MAVIFGGSLEGQWGVDFTDDGPLFGGVAVLSSPRSVATRGQPEPTGAKTEGSGRKMPTFCHGKGIRIGVDSSIIDDVGQLGERYPHVERNSSPSADAGRPATAGLAGSGHLRRVYRTTPPPNPAAGQGSRYCRGDHHPAGRRAGLSAHGGADRPLARCRGAGIRRTAIPAFRVIGCRGDLHLVGHPARGVGQNQPGLRCPNDRTMSAVAEEQPDQLSAVARTSSRGVRSGLSGNATACGGRSFPSRNRGGRRPPARNPQRLRPSRRDGPVRAISGPLAEESIDVGRPGDLALL